MTEDTITRITALDDERTKLLADLRAERVELKARLEKLDELLGPQKRTRVKKAEPKVPRQKKAKEE